MTEGHLSIHFHYYVFRLKTPFNYNGSTLGYHRVINYVIFQTTFTLYQYQLRLCLVSSYTSYINYIDFQCSMSLFIVFCCFYSIFQHVQHVSTRMLFPKCTQSSLVAIASNYIFSSQILLYSLQYIITTLDYYTFYFHSCTTVVYWHISQCVLHHFPTILLFGQ